MLKTGVLCTGIDNGGKSQLFDAGESLDERMLHDIEK